MPKLPINIDDLLRQRTVERDRIEYKKGWNPPETIQTLCAFANDFENLGGGYVIIGQDCDDGRPIFPPAGLRDSQLDRIQQELQRYCNLLRPTYFPMLSIERIEGQNLIILWAPGGQNRPYSAPRDVTAKQKEYRYFIRRYSCTVELKPGSEEERELISLTAKIPFDDRQCFQGSLETLRRPLVRDYLREVGSGLAADAATLPFAELCRQMRIVEGGDEALKPRNVGVLFFSDQPHLLLPGAQIDVVMFPQGVGGGEIVEKTFHGPIHEQVRAALLYIKNLVIQEKVIKHPDRAEATRFFNYPFAAIEEVVVNAVYHRSYEQPEPVEVRINPDCIEVVSYPGPDASIEIAALNGERIVARRYRNRRIGEFLKELDLTEGRCTGIPTIRHEMKKNGSPKPKFQTDDARTYFLATLPVHRSLPGIGISRESQVSEGKHVLSESEQHALTSMADGPQSRLEIADAIGHSARGGTVNRTLARLLQLNLIEMTIPDKPSSPNQTYRITTIGKYHLRR